MNPNEIYEGLIVATLLSGTTYWPITRLVAMPIGGAILLHMVRREPLTEKKAKEMVGTYLMLLIPLLGEGLVYLMGFGLLCLGAVWVRDRGAELLMRASTNSNSSDRP